MSNAEPISSPTDASIERLLRTVYHLQIAAVLLIAHIVLCWLPWTLPTPLALWLLRTIDLLMLTTLSAFDLLLALAALALLMAVWQAPTAIPLAAPSRCWRATLLWTGLMLVWCLYNTASMIVQRVADDLLHFYPGWWRDFHLAGAVIVVLGLPIAAALLFRLNGNLGQLLMPQRRLRALALLTLLAAALWIGYEIYWECTAGATLRRIWSSPTGNVIAMDPPPGSAPLYGYLELGMQRIPVMLLLCLCFWQLICARRRVASRHSRCLGCGYDLSGAPHQRCPECGRQVWGRATRSTTQVD
jgi:predicted RNA-binding Zn-ribbon protein involved in translation (DUF1610 family)